MSDMHMSDVHMSEMHVCRCQDNVGRTAVRIEKGSRKGLESYGRRLAARQQRVIQKQHTANVRIRQENEKEKEKENEKENEK
jgi:hypothetical protein